MRPSAASSEPGRLAGFDSLRLLAALSVIFSHSFLIATRSEDSEPFVRLLGPKNILGLYGVFTFFSISGFLLARSLSRNPNAAAYAVSRTLRILPAFVFCTLITAFLIGPLCSSLGVHAYFSSRETVEFLKTSLNSFGDMPLPGVFAYGTDNLSRSVNGSLWSLRCEALSYVALLALWITFRSSGVVAGVISGMAVMTVVSPSAWNAMPGIAYTLPYFAGGVLMNWVQNRFGTTWQGAIISVLALIGSAIFGQLAAAFALFGAYLVVFIGERRNFMSRTVDRIGDCSYGLYLFGWPVQQIVKQVTGTTDPMTLFVLAVPPAFGLALLSCHLVELPAMRLRRTSAAKAAALVARAVDSFGPGRQAAVLGAKVAFVVGTLLVLTSRSQWWYFLESMAAVLVGTVAVAVASGVMVRTLSRSQVADSSAS